MTFKIRCIIWEKEFEMELPQFMTLVKCPICGDYIRYKYYFIGLSESVAPEVKGWHKIVKNERKE